MPKFRTKTFLTSLALVLSLVLGGAFYCIWYNPITLRLFYDKALLQMAIEEPELLSSLRPLDSLGLAFYRRHLTDVSLAQDQRKLTFYRQTLADLESYKNHKLEKSEAMSYRIFKDYLTDSIETAEQWAWYHYPVTQLDGIQLSFPELMIQTHLVHNVREAHDYILRLQELPRKMQQTLEQMEEREKRGLIAPRFALEGALAQVDAFLEPPAEQSILLTSLQEKLEHSKLSKVQKAHIIAQAQDALSHEVYPAFRELKAHLERILPQTSNDAGLWRFPEGDKAYRHQLRFHTTLDLDPEAVHQLGLQDVARLEAEMRALFAKEYGSSEGTIDQLFQHLVEDPRYYYPDSEEGRKQILEDYTAILKEIEAKAELFVNALPRAKVIVERMPAIAEKSAPGGSYTNASLDGAIPGKFHVNLFDIKATPKFGMRTLSYHEMVPGHHLQTALGFEIKGLPFFRRLMPFTAYVEGWALYAEYLAWELGFMQKPSDNLGRLQSELFRSVRLVVDTGIHAKRWSREQAIAYMKEHTGMALSEVTAEVERYSVDPGQACAYKIGMMKILELRAQAQKELGPRFSIPEFHKQILEEGPIPLPLLEEKIQRWITETKLHA